MPALARPHAHAASPCPDPRPDARLLPALALLAVTLLAAWLRLPELALRPMHGDEAIHAQKFNDLWSTGRYQYDPREYHGPTLYFLAWPLAQLSGAQSYQALSETTLRLSTALLGIALVPLLWLVRDGFDSPGVRRRAWIAWAGLLCAASPLFVFYARYYIQETLLVFWTFAAIACAWRFQVQGRNLWLVPMGLSVGLMLATKETSVIALFCAGVAAPIARWKFSLRDAATVAGVAIVAAVLCYTSLGRNPRGALDALGTLSVYVQRAGGGEAQGALHQNPPGQYFEWLLWFSRPLRGQHWSEWGIALLALVGIAVALGRWIGADREEGPSWTRFALVYTLSMALVYSLIPYKTPWCAMGFWHGATWLGGIGAASLASGKWWKQAALGAAILALSWDLSNQARAGALDERLMLNRNNPWVYAHPIMQVKREVQVLARAIGDREVNPLVVIAPDGDYWPIPFYARSLRNLSYPTSVPPQLKAARPAAVIASPEVAEQVGRALGSGYEADFIGLRRGLPPLSLFVRRDVEARRQRLRALEEARREESR